MPVTPILASQALKKLSSFDAIIDARSPAEYELDRLPNAVNWPSLNDEERVTVGTLHKQVSAFDARRVGAALVAKNIAAHIERELHDKPKSWKPLVYCWRGGKRSGSLALILAQIGYDVTLIEGGYKAFRAELVADIDRLANQFDYRVICGPTGSGKTRLLQALALQGSQVLDLEALAEHRSSVLGSIPGKPQPSQKQFDTRIWQALQAFATNRTVFIESESKKVGNVAIPEALIAAMRLAPCIRIELDTSSRVALLLEDYDHFVQNTAAFSERLNVLIPLRGRETVAAWQAAIADGNLSWVVQELLTQHYDPSYFKSMERNFKGYANAAQKTLVSHDMKGFEQLASSLAEN